jgi:hypothetical protein
VSRRLTIAVPESLYDRLQNVKQEINISGVCQEALEMAVTLKELTIDSDDRETLIERLRLERKGVLNQIKEQGFKFGQKSAHNLSYQDFQRLEQRKDITANLDAADFEDMWEFLNSHKPQAEMGLDQDGLCSLLVISEHNKSTFVKGWIEGVLSIWNDIKNQVNAPDLE